MKFKRVLLISMIFIAVLLAGCEPLMVLDPAGPQAETITNTIWISVISMAFVVITVIVLYIYYVIKGARRPADYKPPHIEGHPVVEACIVGIPILIVAFLSVVSVVSTYSVEAMPEEYQDEEPLVIYASSSDWKWHFSYPEQNIETVNYMYVPTNRPIEFRLYSHGSISSFWIPQFHGQKYAMGDMINTLNIVVEEPGTYAGRNANYTGEGFAHQTFSVEAVPSDEFDQWVDDVHSTAEPITEDIFNQLIEADHLGQMTFTGTHLEFAPPSTSHHGHAEGGGQSH